MTEQERFDQFFKTALGSLLIGGQVARSNQAKAMLMLEASDWAIRAMAESDARYGEKPE